MSCEMWITAQENPKREKRTLLGGLEKDWVAVASCKRQNTSSLTWTTKKSRQNKNYFKEFFRCPGKKSLLSVCLSNCIFFILLSYKASEVTFKTLLFSFYLPLTPFLLPFLPFFTSLFFTPLSIFYFFFFTPLSIFYFSVSADTSRSSDMV